MAFDQTATEEKAWGPWTSVLPKPGQIFIMRLTPHEPVPSVASMHYRFRLKKIENGYMYLESWSKSRGAWVSDHSLDLQNGPTFRMLNEHADGCVCMRCNAKNEWAIPNRPNGKYLCYECR